MATDFTESFPHGGPGSSNEGGGQCGAADVAGAAKGRAQAAVGQAQEKAQRAAGQAQDKLREQIDHRSAQAAEQINTQASDLRSVSGALRQEDKDRPADASPGTPRRSPVTCTRRMQMRCWKTRGTSAASDRHAGAERVRDGVWGSGDGLWAEVSDDGRGFDTASPASPIRRGITGMRERAGLLGRRLEIDSEPAVGTRMRLEAPLANARS